MEKVNLSEMKYVREEINECSNADHIQQVAYSTYHDALTQICFTCKTVRTNIDELEQ